jgi:PhnB protein
MKQANAVPPAYHKMTPYLTVKDASKAIDFYRAAFGATELYRLVGPDGKVGHAELQVGDSRFMLSDEYPDFGALSPPSVGGSPVKFHLYVADVDSAVQHAVSVGATLVRAVKDEFYGDRTGMVADPFGFSWFIASQREEVSPEEMQKRWSSNFAVTE